MHCPGCCYATCSACTECKIATYCYQCSVCLSVGHNHELCQNGWTDRDATWLSIAGGSSKSCAWLGSDPPPLSRKGNLYGRAVLRCGLSSKLFDHLLLGWLQHGQCGVCGRVRDAGERHRYSPEEPSARRPLLHSTGENLTPHLALALSIRYDTIRDAILTCARKPTQVRLIYRTEPTTKKV